MTGSLPDYKLLFESAPLLILVLTPELHILAGTDAYFAATLTKREEVTGMLVYDVFPDNPNDPNPTGVANLKASFNRVLQNKVPDAMGHLKYDIPREDGSFESRYWSTMNTPVLDEHGDILHIINQVVDITDYITLQQKGEQYEKLTQELKERAQNMESEIYQRAQQLQAANQKLGSANEELRATQEELQSANEEMQAAHEELRAQQEELYGLNARLSANNESLEKTSLALQLKAEELEKSNSFKTDFLSNMSHELRTPLNSMLILSKILSNNTTQNLTDKQVEQASVIYKAGNDLLTLINDILDLTKIEAGKMEMAMEPTPVRDILENLENIFRSVAAQKEIQFRVQVSPAAVPVLHTDQFRLEQVLKNLLSNAFKFTGKDGIVTLTVASPPQDVTLTNSMLLQKDIARIMFSVSDTGIGIPPEKQADIFDAFRQADGSTSRKYGGTGLGLSISRQLAGLLGGEIQLESVPGQGSCFSIYLPVAAKPQEHAEPATNGQDAPHHTTIQQHSTPVPQESMKHLLRGKKIVIADDDPRNITALSAIFDPYGPVLLPASNGKEVLSILRGEEADLILLDIMMPEMDGYETVSMIRSDAQLKHLPVIVMTARLANISIDKEFLANISGYLHKPLDITQLLDVIAQTLQAPNGSQTLSLP